MSALTVSSRSCQGCRLDDLLRAGAELRETHISWVYLTEADAFKIKKPVSLGFLDFSSLERRRRACHAELRLNQRLAPGIYRGLIPVTLDSQGFPRLGGSGEAVDWAVHMVRLPDCERCDRRLEEGSLGAAEAGLIARRLAEFHSRAETSPEISRFGSIEVIRRNLEENFAQTRHSISDLLSPEQAEEIEQWQMSFLKRNSRLFESRVCQGRIRDCHGDLRLEHIYLTDTPQHARPASRGERPQLDEMSGSRPAPIINIIDCIEFNRRFRFSDVCSDVAFLAMDLTWQGHPHLAELFLAAYAREANDFDLYPLVDFYESYRAFLRAKVSSMLAAGSDSESVRVRARQDARRFYLLALASERRPLLPPALVAVGGLIAAGKSTVAEALSQELAAPVISSDRARKCMLGLNPFSKLRCPAWQGAYSPRFGRQVYAEVLRRAESVLSSGRTVIIDASFWSCDLRKPAGDVANRLGVPFCFVECQAPPALCLKRLKKRCRRQPVSDGRAEIFEDFRSRYQPADEIPCQQRVLLDTSLPLQESIRAVRRRLSAC